ncbi:proline dehydrogenase [Erythrobacter sp. SG61-1L]|uniref:hypothetical protein n=1 Tax=Erythrobacter sp. SG61-1L TaxID=1603897 RepID=UPI0006C933E9|nr:hypothetical protein [Erythrobacter sp. SG61-1L]KPL69598.1 proline dehydrogenase [Erythrobacter sp. SG61-1L]
MSLSPWGIARSIRYALPRNLGRLLPAPDANAITRHCASLARNGLAATAGYFQADDAAPEAIAEANRALALLPGMRGSDFYLSVKAPPLNFDAALIGAIAEAAQAAGIGLLLDAHAPKDAEATLGLTAAFPGMGIALPARWQRSPADAACLRDTPSRIRIVKGEWPDPAGDVPDIAASYLALARSLAGRTAPVAIATHDPALAEAALKALRNAGTPCELEQLRGLPRRRTTAIARRLGVPVRLYLPFGPGWWPYALNSALARPYLPLWAAKDWLGLK